jgi:L-ascorbate metabolism protein UlaG (beta-lactamase superfamily)
MATLQLLRHATLRLSLGDLTVTRTPARHGHGDLAERMGPVSGFVLEAPGEPTVYHTSDTVWYDGVRETLAANDLDIVVANAGAAQFAEGDPITMTPEGMVTLCDHTDAINHCLATREDLRAAVADAGVAEQVVIPADGETVDLG